MAGILYLISTPIGNLADMTFRSVDILSKVAVLACEDTRNTQKLLNLLGVKTAATFVSYHEYNADKMRPKLIQFLQDGKDIALVSDAGTPLVSDPGYRLVKECRAVGLTVVPVPGANAVLPALQLSGLPSDHFFFNGFLSAKKSARKAELQVLKNVPATLIFYESPHRVLETLQDMLEIFSDRKAAVVRELTKKFEEVQNGTLSELVSFYTDNGEPKGEIVILVDRPEEQQSQDFDIHALLTEALGKYASLRDAVDAVTKQTQMDRRKIYKEALDIKNG